MRLNAPASLGGGPGPLRGEDGPHDVLLLLWLEDAVVEEVLLDAVPGWGNFRVAFPPSS